jgi:hypothetical protein
MVLLSGAEGDALAESWHGPEMDSVGQYGEPPAPLPRLNVKTFGGGEQ